MHLFCCPLCGGKLWKKDRSLICLENHVFDYAKEGYVNLLPVQAKHSKAPGDDKEMAVARRAFLEKGHYAPLKEALCALAVEAVGEREKSSSVLDAGCGEGYYTAGIYRALCKMGKDVPMGGTDISKFILRSAARREPEIAFAVASSYHLPLESDQIDLLLNCFSPLAIEEFRRVLRPGGSFFYVVPGPQHLWELKEVLYETPYPNEEKLTPYAGFFYERVEEVDVRLELPEEDVKNLFAMTPYAWKTPRRGRERLEKLSGLSVLASFRIHVFSKQ